MLKKMLPIVIAMLFVTTVISCVVIAVTMMRSNAEIEDFEGFVALIQTEDNIQNHESGDTEAIFTRNLTPLYERNRDCIGWVCIPNTVVNYPVMHTPQDPQKYLRKNFDCEYSSSGVPFLHENNTLDSDNLIIYGHNMKNGTMFSDIIKYCEKSYCAEHPAIEWETKQGLKVYTVFAVVQVKDQDEWYRFITAADEEDYENRIKAISEASLYTSDIKPRYGQQLLTLSTCYGSSENDRLIVIAVEMN